jgi:hypothetical protein
MKADQLIRTVEVHDRNGQVIGSKEVVTYQGLLQKAHEEGLARLRTSLLQIPTEDNGRVAIAKAEVETGKGLFEAIGDACPENVDEFLAPHLIRVAETRAKARALRDAVNVGVVSFEELDGVRLPPDGGSPGSGSGRGSTANTAQTGRSSPAPRARAPIRRPAASGNGSEPMTEAQRRYLFRILSGQGYQREAAEERLKDLLEVERLSVVTKASATKLIDELLNAAPGNGTAAHGATSHHQR